jgi:hypothetical protein
MVVRWGVGSIHLEIRRRPRLDGAGEAVSLGPLSALERPGSRVQPKRPDRDRALAYR